MKDMNQDIVLIHASPYYGRELDASLVISDIVAFLEGYLGRPITADIVGSVFAVNLARGKPQTLTHSQLLRHSWGEKESLAILDDSW